MLLITAKILEATTLKARRIKVIDESTGTYKIIPFDEPLASKYAISEVMNYLRINCFIMVGVGYIDGEYLIYKLDAMKICFAVNVDNCLFNIKGFEKGLI